MIFIIIIINININNKTYTSLFHHKTVAQTYVDSLGGKMYYKILESQSVNKQQEKDSEYNGNRKLGEDRTDIVHCSYRAN